MAHLYKRRNKYWICYYVKGQKIQESLHTDNERIAREKKRKIEYDLSIGRPRSSSSSIGRPAIQGCQRAQRALKTRCRQARVLMRRWCRWKPIGSGSSSSSGTT